MVGTHKEAITRIMVGKILGPVREPITALEVLPLGLTLGLAERLILFDSRFLVQIA
jgi:hypothetical protein